MFTVKVRVRNLLEKAVTKLTRFQDILGPTIWLGVFEESALIYRTYYWSVQRMTEMPLETHILSKLKSLNL